MFLKFSATASAVELHFLLSNIQHTMSLLKQQGLNFVGIHPLDLLWLDAQVLEGLSLGAVVKADHELGESRAVDYPLDVTEGFAQSVGAEVPLEVDGGAPPLYQAVYGRDGERSPLSCEKRLVVMVISRGQEFLDGIDADLIEGNPSWLLGLLLFHLERIEGPKVLHLAGRYLEKIDGAKVGIDADGKKGEIPGPVCEESFYGADVFYRL